VAKVCSSVCVCIDPGRRNRYLHGHGYDDKTRYIILIKGAVTFGGYAVAIGDGTRNNENTNKLFSAGRWIRTAYKRTGGIPYISRKSRVFQVFFFFFFACKHSVIQSTGLTQNSHVSRNITCAHTHVYTHTQRTRAHMRRWERSDPEDQQKSEVLQVSAETPRRGKVIKPSRCPLVRPVCHWIRRYRLGRSRHRCSALNRSMSFYFLNWV
jgi:hypothetical protein